MSANHLFSRLTRLMGALVRMSRPTHLFLITLVYTLGAVIARANGFPLSGGRFWYGLLTLIPVSASVHYANEYADFETDARTVHTLFSGGSGALSETGLPRQLALGGAWGTLILGVGLAFAGLKFGLLAPAGLGMLCLGAFFGWMYSLPPLALAWRGWGELDNALAGGVVLPLYGYAVHAGRLDWRVILGVLPFGGLAFINLLATTWADREADAAVGKFTLATRWSILQLRTLYLIVAGASFLLLLILLGWALPMVIVWSSFIVLPVVALGAMTYTQRRNPFPSVAAMVLMLAIQLFAWWSLTGYCCV